MQHQTGVGSDGDREGVGNGVVDGEVLAVERPVLCVLTLDHLDEIRPQPVFTALGRDQREGELRSDDGQVGTQPKQERDCADVVLVTVRQYHRLDVGHAVLDVPEVGQDEVDARLLVLGEQDATVDDQHLALMLEDGHVATDFADSAERDHS